MSIVVRVEGSIRWIGLDRPASARYRPGHGGRTDARARGCAHEPCVLIVHSTTPGIFAAGADIAELRDRDADAALLAINAGLFQRLEEHRWPTIALIDGQALAEDCELALACDFRLACDTARGLRPAGAVAGHPGRSRRKLAARRSWPGLRSPGACSTRGPPGCRRRTGRGIVDEITAADDLAAPASSGRRRLPQVLAGPRAHQACAAQSAVRRRPASTWPRKPCSSAARTIRADDRVPGPPQYDSHGGRDNLTPALRATARTAGKRHRAVSCRCWTPPPASQSSQTSLPGARPPRRCSATPRTVGGPALRALTFAERAAILKALAKHLSGHLEEFAALSARTGATRRDTAVDVDGGSDLAATRARAAGNCPTLRSARRARRTARQGRYVRRMPRPHLTAGRRRSGERVQLPCLGNAGEIRARVPRRNASSVKPASQTAY